MPIAQENRTINFLKKHLPSIVIIITFAALVVGMTKHSLNQPLEWDEYWARLRVLDREYDKLFRESTWLFGGKVDSSNTDELIERLNTITQEQLAAWRKELKTWVSKSSTLMKKRERLERRSPLRLTLVPQD